MKQTELLDVYYSQNKEAAEYLDIFIVTDKGVLKNNLTNLDIVSVSDLSQMNRLTELDKMKDKYGKLFIQEARKTYDNDMYLMISGKWILAMEYVFNSNSDLSTHEFRFIEDIETSNKSQDDFFKDLDLVELPV